MKTKIINLISGPRNISTALMYSFASRMDTIVVDEPMYAFYLKASGATHPGREEILKTMPVDIKEVKQKLLFPKTGKRIYFIKGMAQHYLNIDLEFLRNMQNVFLIRDPYKLILSFSKMIPNPTMIDIGLKKECEIYSFLMSKNEKIIVLDSQEILKDPKKVITQLCGQLGIPFRQEMLQWKAGTRNEDGVWAKYWYADVHKSTGFAKLKKSEKELPSHLMPLYKESLPYYKMLWNNCLKA